MEQRNSDSHSHVTSETVHEGKLITAKFFKDLVTAVKAKDTDALSVITGEGFERTSQSFHRQTPAHTTDQHEHKRMIFWPTFFEACEGTKLFNVTPAPRKKGERNQQANTGDSNAKNTEVIFNFFRTRHIFSMSGYSQQNNGYIAAADVLDTISSYVMKGLFPMDIPNNLLWSILTEHMSVLECAYNSQRAPDITAFRLDEISSRLRKIVNDSNIIDIVGQPLESVISAVSMGSKARCKYVYGILAHIIIANIYVSVCDYRTAIDTLCAIDLFGNGGIVLSKIDVDAFVRANYLAGFSFMMCRRYHDAIKAFDRAANIECDSRDKLKTDDTAEEKKSKSQRDTTERIMKKSAKLMVVCAVVSGEADIITPSYVESEADIQDIRSFSALPDLKALGALFYDNAPIFIRVVRPTDEQQISVIVEQRKVFLRQMDQQFAADKLRGYFKTYTSLTTDKLNKMIKNANIAFPIAHLIAAKKSSTQRVHNTDEEDTLQGVPWAIYTPIQFLVSGDRIIPVSKEKNSIDLLVLRITEAKRS